jgi:hypothetical protein
MELVGGTSSTPVHALKAIAASIKVSLLIRMV